MYSSSKINEYGTYSNGRKVGTTSAEFIPENKLYFHIEQIPDKMNFFDLIKFKNFITTSITGRIIKTFQLKKYLVLIYIKDVHTKNPQILLLSKIDCLKKIISPVVYCELWIIKDVNFGVIALLESVPIFFKSFEDLLSLNEHMDLMIKSIYEYHSSPYIRFFGCSAQDFSLDSETTFEYSEDFLDSHFGGKSLTEHCRNTLAQSNQINWSMVWQLLAIGTLLSLSAGLVFLKQNFAKNIEQYQQDILKLHTGNTLPSYQHYLFLKSLAKSEST